ncbi:MAG TPA: YceH family protein [Gemmatimonadaceae bacterium]
MQPPLDAIAVRILGALIEKEITTPDNYPLSLNALVAACNQTSAREPVMTLDEGTVNRTVNDLRQRSLVRAVQQSGSRVLKFRHLMVETFNLDGPELAAMCVLMLRGPQTPGEIKGRSNRLFDFPDLEKVESTLDALVNRERPLVARLARRPGQKDSRYAHLLSGDAPAEAPEAVTPSVVAENTRLEALEQAVNSLRAELVDLRTQMDDFRRQFQ